LISLGFFLINPKPKPAKLNQNRQNAANPGLKTKVLKPFLVLVYAYLIPVTTAIILLTADTFINHRSSSLIIT